MKRYTKQHRGTILTLILALVGVLAVCAMADYRPGANTRLDSTFTGASANVGIHTPVVQSVPGVSASFTSNVFTSATIALDFTTVATITTAFDLIEFHVHTAAIDTTGTITLEYDSSAGSLFDVPLATHTFTDTDFVFRPTRPIPFGAGDALRVIYPNSGGNVVATTIKYVTPE